MTRRFPRLPGTILAVAAIAGALLAAPAAVKIYWGDSVPKGWNGAWPVKLRTVAEQTRFERTAPRPRSSSSSMSCAGRATRSPS